MLSKVAERVYWLARYLERTESTARMVLVYYHQVLDLPREVDAGWHTLLSITSSSDDFAKRNMLANEDNVVRYLLCDEHYSGSILSSIRYARENVRTTRDMLPIDTWELINEAHLYVSAHAEHCVARKDRYEFLNQVIRHCQLINGMLSGTMSDNAAYGFIRMGRNLERADMTSRMLDVGANAILHSNPKAYPFRGVLWMNLLKALGALEMYRRYEQPRIKAKRVVRYIMQDPAFPRAMLHCLAVVEHCLRNLPNSATALEELQPAKELLQQVEPDALVDEGGLHGFIDKFQLLLIRVNAQVSQTWFQLPVLEQSQESAS